MSQFVTRLDVEQVEDTSHSGRGTWMLLNPLVYQSDLIAELIIVPAGFTTDFASVPRIPMIFDWLGDRGNLAATVHDYLYTAPHPLPSRDLADQILYEALIAQGVPELDAQAIYEGVRLGGESYYQ